MLMSALHDINDDELVASIATLTGTAREATAALVAHLAELEARGLHLALGFRSLYGYCRTILHLSEHESYNRMEAAGVARRFPVILPMLADGLLHLTAVCLLGPRLDDENHLALLGGAIHESKREVEELLARWFPKREVWARDSGRCAFTGGGGRRCDERRFLEFHHVMPWVVGGAPITENIALRCRAHNAYEAAVYFGPIREAREARTRSGTSSSPMEGAASGR